MRVFLIAIVLHGVAVLTQAVFAGLALTGYPSALSAHISNGQLVLGIGLLQVAVVFRLRRTAGTPLWPLVASIGMLIAEALQMLSGHQRLLAIHLPLGVAIFTGLALLAAWTWTVGLAAFKERNADGQIPAQRAGDVSTPIARRLGDGLRSLVRWGAYPALLASASVVYALAVLRHWPYGETYGLSLIGLVAVLILLEWIFPYRNQWRMTSQSLLRDLKYIAASSLIIAMLEAAFGLVAMRMAQSRSGLLAHAPVYAALPAALLAFETLNYAHHRASHEMPGGFGRFLWLTHVAHHLPNRVYVVMHAAFHPVNVAITRIVVTLLPLQLLGISPETTLAFNLLVGLHAMISHCNADIRAGWLNYLFIGTELHRFHHSADEREAKNYGAVLAVWDLAFGTFYYRPGRVPARLGVARPADYPDSGQFWKVMWLPFTEMRAYRTYPAASPS